MALADIINQIRNLSQRYQQRLKEFFTNSLGSAGETESVFTDVSEQKQKDGYTCIHCQSTNVIRFGKYQVKTTIGIYHNQKELDGAF
ncbi:hypothetical protein [Peribacillus butanolivorans]|uniref:hypothetical protein n=1 Tax=Peribacillus butanolivorans TaxID=421767 RepID=UPI0036DBC02D